MQTQLLQQQHQQSHTMMALIASPTRKNNLGVLFPSHNCYTIKKTLTYYTTDNFCFQEKQWDVFHYFSMFWAYAVFVLELCQHESGFEVLLNAQKCQFSDGVAIRLLPNFRLTCPVSAVHTLQDTKLSSQLKKVVLKVRQGAILQLSQSLQLHMANHAYQLQVRWYELEAKLRCEIHRGMTSKAARTFTIKMGTADLHHNLELLGLAVDNNFKVEKSKNRLDDLDPLLGAKWDIRLKQDDRYYVLTHEFISLRQQLVDGDNSVVDSINDIECRLKAIYTKKIEGILIRSRAEWLEDGEHPTRYFFQLQSSNVQKGEEIKQEEIEQAHVHFYSSLFSNKPIDLDSQDDLLSSLSRQLLPHQSSLCDFASQCRL